MAERIFPDPNSSPEFVAENGIRYKWSDEKSRWEVASSNLTNDETQAQIDTIKGDIVTLQQEIEELSTNLENGKWKHVAAPDIDDGNFVVGHGTPETTTEEWSEVEVIYFKPNDLNGDTHGFGGINQHDRIELIDSAGNNFGLYEVDQTVDDTANTLSWAFAVHLIRGKGQVTHGTEFTVQFFRLQQSGGGISMDDADNRYEKLYHGGPIGSIVFWPGERNRIPAGWVECKGQSASSYTAWKNATGRSTIPKLQDYMPCGAGGRFGSSIGSVMGSRISKHKHMWSGPSDRKGYPSSSADTSEGSKANQSYWRGNKYASNSSSNGGLYTTESGDDYTAPPVYLGIWITRVS